MLWVVVSLSISIGLLGWFAYQAVTGWERTATQLAHRRAEESADLLALALTRDMRAVQTSVLMSPHWDELMIDAPFDMSPVVASAFARYPYPETFFATGGPLRPEHLLFFNRADRSPSWMPASEASRYPVIVASHAPVARLLVERIRRDTDRRRRFSLFEAAIDGVPYQVVVRLMYRDALRQELTGVFGFMVNTSWVREHYFSEVARQVTAMGRVTNGDSLMVLDDRGEVVAGASRSAVMERANRKEFAFLFFDPLLATVDPPDDLPLRSWAVAASDLDDPSLASAIDGARRTLLAAGASALMLVLGVVLTARAARTRARLSELRTDFVSTVTHELKTPIATLRAVGDTLVSGRLTTPEAHRQYAGLIVQESKRLTRLVDNLLAYSRITDVTEAYSFEPLAPEALVDELLQRFRSTIDDQGFDVVEDVPETLPPVYADRTAMELLFDNLLDNAIRYSGASRRLAIVARPAGEAVALSVRDEGIGIPADELPHITRRFYRGRRAGSGGSGLGLAIASRIVRDHGGRLSIESEPGRGTTVTVLLPAAGPHHA
jgi:signal transduction histidine kinase